MGDRTPSQIGRSNRRKGARFENAVATAIRPWFPDARRSRDNGSATTMDTGDLAGAGDGLWWSLKDVAAARTDPPGLIRCWLDEASIKGEDRIPLLVQKRAGHADALHAWCWLWLGDLASLFTAEPVTHDAVLVRLELHAVLDLLAAAGHARTPDQL